MTINCKGELIDLKTPKIMGILNLTPDSFYDGGSYKTDKSILLKVERMLNDGADFIDIGGQSTRPTSEFLSVEEESKRVLPILEKINKAFPEAIISIDTFYSEVARKAVENGAAIINDISAGNLDDKMIKTAANLQVPYIMMHMRGKPQTMQSQKNVVYDNMLQEIILYFSEKIKQAQELGLNDIILDPGFGFSKTVKGNLALIKNLNLFKNLEFPILMGVSRKSSICKILETTPDQALNGTTVLNTISLLNGVNVLRVHDIREAWEAIQLFEAYNE